MSAIGPGGAGFPGSASFTSLFAGGRRMLTEVICGVAGAVAIAAVAAAVRARRTAERRLALLQTKEQELLGRVAAGLAHELKNPLGALNLNLQLLEEELASCGGLSHDSQARLGTIMKETRRLEDVLDNFLRYARRRQLVLSDVGINDLVEEVITFLKPEIVRSHVTVETDFSGELPSSRADASLVKQALLNVILNAVEAMPGGGTLGIRTSLAGSGVSIVVTDDGVGVAEENMPRLFDAYFSTRTRGTGLGLPITKRIVEGHGGTIELERRIVKGTAVTLVFPLCAPSAGT